MNYPNIISFVAITILLIVTPGSDMALIARSTVSQGQMGALAAMLGINLASITWTILAIIGFVALVNTVPYANTVLMLIGAIYMGNIGVKDIERAIKARRNRSVNEKIEAFSETKFQLFKKGLLVNASNPKIGLYYVTVLPNFIKTETNQGLYIFYMGLTHNILGFIWFMSFAFLLRKGANLMGGQSKEIITLLTGISLIAFSATAIYYAIGI